MPTDLQFRGVRLQPDVPEKLDVPDGHAFVVRQFALSSRARAGVAAVVSVRTAGNPELVLCSLREGSEQWWVGNEMVLCAEDEPVLVAAGAAVDVAGALYPVDTPEDEARAKDEAAVVNEAGIQRSVAWTLSGRGNMRAHSK